MKLLIFSDSHGSTDPMFRVTEQIRPDRILHLGDGFHDAQALQARFPEIPLEQVPGNCDYQPTEPAERLLELDGVRILMCHGHTYGVKQSLLSLHYAAQEKGAGLALFGHTHRPFCDLSGSCWLVNPGSIGNRLHPAYAVIELRAGQVFPSLLELC